MRTKLFLSLLLVLSLLMPAAIMAEGETELRVTATFYPLYVAAINVADGVSGLQIDCLAPPSAGCLHDYQMTTADRRALEDTDVLIMNGAGLETFLDKVLPTLSADVIDASAGIALLENTHDHEEEAGIHDHDVHDHELNPHVWVSVLGMRDQVRNIAAGLSEIDPANAERYMANAEAYCDSLDALYELMTEALAPYAGAPIVTFHEAFDYFARDFDLRVVATVQHEHDAAPSAREMAETADIIRAENVKALFAEPQYEDTSVDILSKETGVPVYLLDPAVSGEVDPTDYNAYTRIMEQNMRTLMEALS